MHCDCMPNGLTEGVIVCVCAVLCLSVYTYKRTAIEIDEDNWCQICRVSSPVSWTVVWSWLINCCLDMIMRQCLMHAAGVELVLTIGRGCYPVIWNRSRCSGRRELLTDTSCTVLYCAKNSRMQAKVSLQCRIGAPMHHIFYQLLLAAFSLCLTFQDPGAELRPSAHLVSTLPRRKTTCWGCISDVLIF